MLGHRSKIRSFIMVLSALLFTLICIIIIVPIGVFFPLGRATHAIERFWAGMLLTWAGVKADVKGIENIHPSHTCIFVSNHQSLFDIPLMMYYSPKQLRMIFKKELLYVPLFGFCLWILKFIAIDRGNREKAVASLKRAAKRIHDGTNIVIYADGTRSLDGELQPFKKGAFMLALEAQVDIVPVSISGTINVMHKYKSLFDVTFDRQVSLTFGKPISTIGMSVDKKDELLNLVKEEVYKNFEPVKELSKIDDPELIERIKNKKMKSMKESA